MECAELGLRVTVAYDDLSDVWPCIQQALESRLPLRQVTLINKLGGSPVVEKLPLQYVAASDPWLQRLQQHAASAVTWFRQPFATLVLISCDDAEDFKRNFRLQLRAMADLESRPPLAPEPVFVYVRPSHAAAADPLGKGAARVMEAMRKELGIRQRERVVRVDPPPPAPPGAAGAAPAEVEGVEELLGAVREAVRCTLESRAAAYSAETRALLGAAALDPGWAFSDLFLVKDSLAAMMEAFGLLDDALREYYELEVCHQQALDAGRTLQTGSGDGSVELAAGRDEAALMWAAWEEARRAAQGAAGCGAPPERQLRQVLFAAQARVLLRARRHVEALQQGLSLVRAVDAVLEREQAAGEAPALLREAWVASASLTLASTVSTLHAQHAQQQRAATGRRSGPGSPVTPASGGAAAGHVIAAGQSFVLGLSPPTGSNHGAAAAAYDWRLGPLPTGLPPGAGLPEPAAPAPGGTGAAGDIRPSAATMYLILGELYCLARHQLERLGAAAGLKPPSYHGDIHAALRCLGTAPSPSPVPSPGASDQQQPAASGSPRRRMRSMSPSRGSLDVGSMARSLLASSAADSDDEVMSLRINTGRGAPAVEGAGAELMTEHMHTVDLSAASAAVMGSGGGEGPGSGKAQNAEVRAEAEAAASAEAAADLQLEPAMSAALSSPTTKLAGAESPAPAHARSLSVHSAAGGSTPAPLSPPRPALRFGSGASGTESAPSTPSSSATGVAQPPPAPPSSAAAPSAAQPPLATTLRQVESILAGSPNTRGLGSAPSEGSDSGASRPASSAEGAPSVWTPVHWRLRRALASAEAFADLWTELSRAAASCLEHGGRRRRAALLRADVADSLARAGALGEAAELYEALCRVALRDGWPAIAAAALPKLAACQAALGGEGLAATAAALASLRAHSQLPGAAAELEPLAHLLLRSACLPAAAEPYPPLLPPPSGGVDAVVDPAGFLAAAPLLGGYCRFYGHSDAAGAPVLLPAGAGAGAVHAAVGDVVVLTLAVDNALPVELPLDEVVLKLVGLQEMAALSSPRAGSPKRPHPFTAAPSGQLGALGTPTSAAAAAGVAAVTPTSMAAVTPPPMPRATSAFEEDSAPRIVMQWQEVEELRCCLVAIDIPAADGDTSAAPLAAHDGPLRPLAGPAALRPGRNLLRFLAGPVKRGLYKAVHISAALGHLQLQLPVHLAPSPWEQQPVRFSAAPAAAARAASHERDPLGAAAHGGGLSVAGQVHEDAIVLVVGAAAPRLAVSLAAAADGCLIAGQRQWLGLHVGSQCDALQGARLEVAWPPPPPPELPRRPSGLPAAITHSRKFSVASDVSASFAAAAPAVEPPPLVLPLHEAAALQPSGAGPTAIVRSSASPLGRPAWAAAEEGAQQLQVPHAVVTGGAFTAWWWVGAAAFVAPPEHVRVAPPGGLQGGLPAVGGGDAPGAALAVQALPVSVEYVSGCRRTYCAELGLPVKQPFEVHSAAREVSSGAIVVTFHLASTLPTPAALTAAELVPQPGLTLVSSVAQQAGLLPAAIPARGALSLTFVLALDHTVACGDRASAQAKLAQAAKLQPSALSVEYEVATEQLCAAPAEARPADGPAAPPPGMERGMGIGARRSSMQLDSAFAVGPRRGSLGIEPGIVSSRGAAPAAESAAPAIALRSPEAEALRRLRDATPVAEEDGEEQGGAHEPQSCAFVHRCCLELSGLEAELPGALVLVQLLGPFTAVAGRPCSLCWRLERSGPAPPGDRRTARLAFEVSAEGDCWRPLGRRAGAVELEPHDGALATVEATWVPLGPGALPVPSLRLHEVPYQELFDVGSAGMNYVQVTPA